MNAQRISIGAAVNDRAILADCLARSPDVLSGALTLKTYEGFSTAGLAYNQALEECDTEWLLLHIRMCICRLGLLNE